MRGRKLRRAAAAFLLAAALCGLQTIPALAGATGVGAAKTEQGGPGVQKQETQQQETQQQGAEQQEAQPDGQGAGQTGQETSAQSPILSLNYSGFIARQGWSANTQGGQPCTAPAGSWLTAMKANLVNIPAGAVVGLSYQVNLSGSGWLDWAYDGAETGNTAAEAPLEAVRMELTGAGAADYDLYYKVYQNGAWTPWALNGATAGTEGAGLRVDGLQAAITLRGAGEPAVSTIDPGRPMVALTFDDGPSTPLTSRILDSLQANGGRATFFMVGSRVAANAGVIQRMVSQGCEVANHTFDHKYISRLSADQIVSQVGATNQAVAAACGVSPVVMRPPGGYIDAASLSTLGSMGMSAIMWSIDTRDWQHRNAQKTIDTVLSQVKDGDIVLMHDIHAASADAAEVLIPALTARGYQLVTVSELAAARGGLLPGQKYSQFRP